MNLAKMMVILVIFCLFWDQLSAGWPWVPPTVSERRNPLFDSAQTLKEANKPITNYISDLKNKLEKLKAEDVGHLEGLAGELMANIEEITSKLKGAVSQLERDNPNGAVPRLLANFIAQGFEPYANLEIQHFVDKNALAEKCQTANDQAEAFTTTNIEQIGAICGMGMDKMIQEGIVVNKDKEGRKKMTEKWTNELTGMDGKLTKEGKILKGLGEEWKTVGLIVSILGKKHTENADKLGQISHQIERENRSEFNGKVQQHVGAIVIEVEDILRRQADKLVQILKGGKQAGDKKEGDAHEVDKHQADQRQEVDKLELKDQIANAEEIRKAEQTHVKMAIEEWNNAAKLVNRLIMVKKTIEKIKNGESATLLHYEYDRVIDFLVNENKILGAIADLASLLVSCLHKLEPNDLNTDTELLKEEITQRYNEMAEKKKEIEEKMAETKGALRKMREDYKSDWDIARQKIAEETKQIGNLIYGQNGVGKLKGMAKKFMEIFFNQGNAQMLESNIVRTTMDKITDSMKYLGGKDATAMNDLVARLNRNKQQGQQFGDKHVQHHAKRIDSKINQQARQGFRLFDP